MLLTLAATAVAAQQPSDMPSSASAVDRAPARSAPPGVRSTNNMFKPNRSGPVAPTVLPGSVPTAQNFAPPAMVAPPMPSVPVTPPPVVAPVPAGPEKVEVPAVFVGRINGMNVYRGSGTYVFDKQKRPEAVPNEQSTTAQGLMPPPTLAPTPKVPSTPKAR